MGERGEPKSLILMQRFEARSAEQLARLNVGLLQRPAVTP
jgi:hypothetical protein